MTDIDLVLGYLNADRFLGGEMRLDVEAAEHAIDSLARDMSTDRIGLAAGAFKIVNAHMADLIRQASIDRGRDPRDFVLFAYGGAAPMHVAYLARELRVRNVYVPSFATVFSALGMLTGGILHTEEITFAGTFPLADETWRDLGRTYTEMELKLSGLFDREGIDAADRRFERTLHMKYRLQPTAVPVPVPKNLDGAGAQDTLVEAFEAQYRALYGANAGYRAAGIEILKCRVDGSAATVVPTLASEDSVGEADPSIAQKDHRSVYFPELGEHRPTPIYDGDRLKPGMSFAGPGVVERMGDTIVVPSFAMVRVDGYSNVVVDVGFQGSAGVSRS